MGAAAHHSAQQYGAPRSQNTATKVRGGRERVETKYTTKIWKTPHLQAFFQLYDEEDAERGLRPASLAEPQGPQERVQLRTVEHIAEVVPMVQILDFLVPQMENQLVEVCWQLHILIPEQAIEVPEISSSSRRCRPRVPVVQLMAEQFVEVPTIVSFSSFYGLVEQNVDIPVPQGRGSRVGVRGPQGFSQGQDSTAFVGADRVDIPVPLNREGGGSLQFSRPGQSLTASDGADHVEIPVPQGRGGVGGPLPSFSGASALPSFSSG